MLRPIFDRTVAGSGILEIDLDGGYGYASSFLEEAFGGLVRDLAKNYDKKEAIAIVMNHVRFVSKEEPYLVRDIERYISEACKK